MCACACVGVRVCGCARVWVGVRACVGVSACACECMSTRTKKYNCVVVYNQCSLDLSSPICRHSFSLCISFFCQHTRTPTLFLPLSLTHSLSLSHTHTLSRTLSLHSCRLFLKAGIQKKSSQKRPKQIFLARFLIKSLTGCFSRCSTFVGSRRFFFFLFFN